MFDVSLKDTWTDFSQLNVEFNNYFNTHDGDIANKLQKVFQISRSKPEIHTVFSYITNTHPEYSILVGQFPPKVGLKFKRVPSDHHLSIQYFL